MIASNFNKCFIVLRELLTHFLCCCWRFRKFVSFLIEMRKCGEIGNGIWDMKCWILSNFDWIILIWNSCGQEIFLIRNIQKEIFKKFSRFLGMQLMDRRNLWRKWRHYRYSLDKWICLKMNFHIKFYFQKFHFSSRIPSMQWSELRRS